jgi:glycosyltransferase involved in cell wall biosynthesis
VHFLGTVPYPTLIKIYQVSAAHVYLTYPFVLSWSILEAMSAGCAVIASRTGPVEEVITHGKNGFLVDFFDPAALAASIDRVLRDREQTAHVRREARRTVVERYDLRRVCLPRHLELLDFSPVKKSAARAPS